LQAQPKIISNIIGTSDQPIRPQIFFKKSKILKKWGKRDWSSIFLKLKKKKNLKNSDFLKKNKP
jgi:hypothetical protein